MIEYKKVKVANSDVHETIKSMELFKWKFTSEDKKTSQTVLYFERDTDIDCYKEIALLEKKWNKETNFSPWPTYAFLILTAICLTLYLLLSFLYSDSSMKLTLFLSCCVPGLFCLLIAFLLMFFRVKKIQKMISSYYDIRQKYREQIEVLENDHEKIKS